MLFYNYLKLQEESLEYFPKSVLMDVSTHTGVFKEKSISLRLSIVGV